MAVKREGGGRPHTLIKEIIIENFMSYEYARIPLRPGLNIICGPNGSGKSSILLALSVALGQTYTERSRRLSDLIRYGKDVARVTVVFKDAPGPWRGDLTLSRYLSRNGTYWYEANHRAATKEEVRGILSQMGVNPDNMLIVMHQNMIDVFSTLDAQEKLVMVEEAVGLHEYREKIRDANERLAHTLSEKESVDKLLEKSRETLAHWEDEYERYLRKRSLLDRREKLGVEYAWSKYLRQEKIVDDIHRRIKGLEGELEEVRGGLRACEGKVEAERERIDGMERDVEATYQEMIVLERERAERWVKLSFLEDAGRGGRPSKVEIPGGGSPDGLREDLKRYGEKLDQLRGRLTRLKAKLSEERERYVEERVKAALLEFREELLTRELASLRADLRGEIRVLEELRGGAEGCGPRLETDRKPREVLDEIRVVNVQLAALQDASPDSEKMYKSYKDLLEDLERKAEVAAENRRRTLEELKIRTKRWRGLLTSLIQEVGATYRKILNSMGAEGGVRMVNLEGIEKAGIEILVGFRRDPQVLDAYTQSGGERATSILCFLLALQKHIKSPIRAIDEFDIHMDPRNREEVMRRLLHLMADEVDQYLVITPRELTEVERIPNLITVQSLTGSSQVTVAT